MAKLMIDKTGKDINRMDGPMHYWADPEELEPVSVFHQPPPLPVFKISPAVMSMALRDVRFGKMPLYVTINAAGDPLSCCGDMETVQIPYETTDPRYVPVAAIEVLFQ